MSSANALALARRRSTARLLEAACLDGGWEVDGRLMSAPPRWLHLGQHRRDIYCSGERRITSQLMDRLFEDCPDAMQAWYSPVWACLDTAATDKHLTTKLLNLAGSKWSSQPIGNLLEHLASQSLVGGPHKLKLVTMYVCAVRLAKNSRRKDLAGVLAMRLARALYFLAVHWLYAPVAEEVWIYCGKTIIRGLRVGDAKVEFREECWNFAHRYIRETEAYLAQVLLPKSPPSRLSARTLNVFLADVLVGLTSSSYADTEYVLSRIPIMRGFERGELRQVPTLETVGLLRPDC